MVALYEAIPYQSLSALIGDEPLGGLSFTEVSAETRLQWHEDWGVVAFIDGGFAYPDEQPKWNDDFLWGAGIGFRYFTSFAPIRLDMAVPLDKRDDIDDDYQIYISIGQSF